MSIKQQRPQELKGPILFKALSDLLQNKPANATVHDIMTGPGNLNHVLFLIKQPHEGDKREILCLYAMHAVMLLLNDKNPYTVLRTMSDKDIATFKTGLEIALSHQYPVVANSLAKPTQTTNLFSKDEVQGTRYFSKHEVIVIKESEAIIRTVVKDNWQQAQTLLRQWSEVIDIFQIAPLTRSEIQQYPGKLCSQIELRNKLGCTNRAHFVKQRSLIQTKYPLSEKWFIKCQDIGNPVFFQVEHFEEYKQLWDAISIEAKNVTRNVGKATQKVVDTPKQTVKHVEIPVGDKTEVPVGGKVEAPVGGKVEVPVVDSTDVHIQEKSGGISEAKVEVSTEPHKSVDLVTVRGWQEYLTYLDKKYEEAFNRGAEAENDFAEAKQKAHETENDPIQRDQYLQAMLNANKIVLESMAEMDTIAAKMEKAKVLTQKQEKLDEERRLIQEKQEQLNAEKEAMMAEYKANTL